MIKFRQAFSRHVHPGEAIGECLYQLMNIPQPAGPENWQSTPPDAAFVSFSSERRHKNVEGDDILHVVRAVKELLQPTICIGIPSSVVGYGGSVSDGVLSGLLPNNQAILVTALWCQPETTSVAYSKANEPPYSGIDSSSGDHTPGELSAHILATSEGDPRVAVPETLIGHDPNSSLFVLASPELLANGQLHMLMTELGIRFPNAEHSALVVDANFGPDGKLLVVNSAINSVDGVVLASSGCSLALQQRNSTDLVSLEAPTFNFVPRHMMAVIAEAHEQEPNWAHAGSIQVGALLHQGVADALELVSGPRWLTLGGQ